MLRTLRDFNTDSIDSPVFIDGMDGRITDNITDYFLQRRTPRNTYLVHHSHHHTYHLSVDPFLLVVICLTARRFSVETGGVGCCWGWAGPVSVTEKR
jgi:hypothetical protein